VSGLGENEQVVCVFEEAQEALKALLDFVTATENHKLRDALEHAFGAMYQFGAHGTTAIRPSPEKY